MEEFKLLQRLEDFEAWVMPRLDSFPRAEKWAAALEIKRSVYRLQWNAIRVQKTPRRIPKRKAGAVMALDEELEFLRLRLRIAASRRMLSQRSHRHATKLLMEIGKMIGGLQARIAQGAQP
ncbi:hypothetical protein [Halorhodospira halophila]|uniref:hypothetical protein n=1 Tax=Halorhodospira halophila TaxID=1053 RepID=UPI0019130B97|nr:hypothetical protein [Halorhodospira halophila]MBK5942706.1 hypothetical protein [Halorhodospira halophila]